MNVSAWCIRNPLPALLLFVLLTVLGLQGYRAMQVQTFPDISLPTVVVATGLPGAAPEQLETEVARKLEDALATLPLLKRLHTRLQDGALTLSAEFRLEKSPTEALEEVRAAVGRVRGTLPAALQEPVISRLNLAGSPILTYTVASDRLDAEGLSWWVDDTLTRRLLGLRGVGAVQRVGGVQRELQVELDPSRLLALGTSAADVARALRAAQLDAPSGQLRSGGGQNAEQPLRTLSTADSADALRALTLALPAASPATRAPLLQLGQLAEVRDGSAEPRSAALLNGRPVVAFEVLRAQGASEVEVAAAVRQALAALQAQTPGLRIDEAFNVVDGVQANFDGSMQLLLEGALLAVLVVWAFLRDWRATAVAATALPLSLIPTFALMQALGLTLNVLTLLSLSLVVGILVDDAIVEIENIVRHQAMGKSARQAALEAADEIGMAVVATTFTLIAVFLPTAFLAGVPGRFFVHFGITASVAVFFSLVVARMLTPMMAAWLLRPPRQAHAATRSRWLALTLRAADTCLAHRRLTLAGTLVLGLASAALLASLPTGFMPVDDMDQTQVRISLPPGAGLADTQAVAAEALALLQAHPQVRSVYTTIGAGSTGSDPFAAGGVPELRSATLTVQLRPRAERGGLRKPQLEQQLRRALAGLSGVRTQVGFGGSGEKLLLQLSADDGDALLRHAQRLEQTLRTLPGVAQVHNPAGLLRPELRVLPDDARAADAGVSAAAIAETLRVATAGDDERSLLRLNFGQRQLPVRVRLAAPARDDPALLAQLPVPGSHGPVPLGQVARLSLQAGPTQIDRIDRQRSILLEAELDGQRPLGEVARLAERLPEVAAPPPGIRVAPAGDREAMTELFDSFALAMGTGVLCIVLVLVLLFKDLAQPATVLGALLLSLPGAVLALALTRSALSMPSLIGLVMLMGITTKNAILLVDYILIARRQGLGRTQAVLDAVAKRSQPIVMTTVAMAAGMLPTALGWGVDPSFRAPMALVTIGGLISSTVLSLLVIPVLYTLVDDAAQALRRGLRALRPRDTAAPQG